MDKIEEEFQCPICLVLAENAVETKCCNHAYCEEHAKTIAAGGGKCPTCRTTPFRYRPAVMARRIINSLPTECPFCKSSSIQRGNLEDHKKNCSKRPATYPAPQPPTPALPSPYASLRLVFCFCFFVSPAMLDLSTIRAPIGRSVHSLSLLCAPPNPCPLCTSLNSAPPLRANIETCLSPKAQCKECLKAFEVSYPIVIYTCYLSSARFMYE